MEFNFLTMDDLDLADKRVIIREDLNVPMKDGIITNDERIQRALPSIKKAIAAKARVLVLSHLGRPEEGKIDETFSLSPVAYALSDALGQTVELAKNWLRGVEIAPGQVKLAENVRFNVGESKDDPKLSERMAKQCDIFVMDAFATAHRAQASTDGIGMFAPQACAGPLLVEELQALATALRSPKRPLIAIVGGSKVSTKIEILESLIDKVDCLIVGGGIANTFIAAQGYSVGKSLYERDWIEKAKKLLEKAKQQGVDVPLPTDVAVAKEFSKEAKAEIKTIDSVAEDEMILDVGSNTAASYQTLMSKAGTIVWNGPVGVFEFPEFANGTQALGKAIANSHAYSIAGGGDTIAAVSEFGIADQISYISTGGGAFLTYLEGKPLPAVSMLESRAK